MATKNLDKDGLIHLWQGLKGLLSNKVDKVEGKGLSTNDFTTAEKNKLEGIEAGADANVIETIQVNNQALTPTGKAVNIPVPTKTSEITNDSGYITSSDIPEGAAASTTTPKMDGTAAVGSELAFARGDHVHPHDSSKANTASPTFTGTPKAPTATKGTDTTQIATTAFVQAAIADKQNTLTFDNSPTSGSSNPVKSGGVYSALAAKLDATTAEATYLKKSDAGTVYSFKGSVNSYSDLPAASAVQPGWVYDVKADGMNYSWTGEEWDALGMKFEIEAITNAEIDAILAT